MSFDFILITSRVTFCLQPIRSNPDYPCRLHLRRLHRNRRNVRRSLPLRQSPLEPSDLHRPLEQPSSRLLRSIQLRVSHTWHKRLCEHNLGRERHDRSLPALHQYQTGPDHHRHHRTVGVRTLGDRLDCAGFLVVHEWLYSFSRTVRGYHGCRCKYLGHTDQCEGLTPLLVLGRASLQGRRSIDVSSLRTLPVYIRLCK